MNAAVLKQSTAIIAPDPFCSKRHVMSVPPGLTITQVIAQAIANDNLPPRWSTQYFRVYVGGEEVPSAWWSRTRLKADSHIAIVTAPQGGGGSGKIFRTVALIAVIALTAWVGGGALVGLLGAGFGAGTVGAALAAAGVSLIGGVIINALAPPPGAASATASQAFSLQGAQNAARPNEPYPVVLGRRRVVPPLAAATYTETVGDDVYLRMLLAWHMGPCTLSDIKIGETPIDQYDGVEMAHRLTADTAWPALYPGIVREQSLQLELKHAVGFVQQTTQRRTSRVSIDFGWPTGLLKNGDRGNEAATVQVQVQIRTTGTSDWANAPVGASGVLTYTENKNVPFRRNIAFDVDGGQYDIRIQRVTADSTDTAMADSVYWVALRSLAEGLPVTQGNLAVTALRIKSSAQLNGVLDNLNGVVQMLAPKWDGSAFTGLGATRNPGEIANWLAVGPANARPLTDRVDIAQLGAWTERCTAKAWNCDHIIDNGGTVEQAMQIVAGAGRGFGAMWFDGKLAVAVDDEQSAPVQIFSARNVSNFQGTISFPGALHAVNVNFADEDNGFQNSTRTVFAAGYDDTNATLFDTIDATGKTNAAEAYVVGWRYLAGRTLRPEVYEFDTAMQNLCVRLGQRADVSHYRMSVGISGARIRALLVDEGEVVGFDLDESVPMSIVETYALRVQSGSRIALYPIATVPGTSNSVYLQSNIAIEDAPNTGDHCVFGVAGRETLATIVIGIGTKSGKDGHITAIPYAPGLLVDGGTIPEWDPQTTPRVMQGSVVGVHLPGGAAITNDNIIQGVNDERAARAAGDAALRDTAAALQAAIDHDLELIGDNADAIAIIAKAKATSDAAIRSLKDDVTRAEEALAGIQVTLPQMRQDYQRQLAAAIQGLTGSDVVDFSARLINVESTVIDLEHGKASASDLLALNSQINTPSTGLEAVISHLAETVALLDPSSATATLAETVVAVRGHNVELDALGSAVLQILQNMKNIQEGQSLSLAFFRDEVTTQVTEGISANAQAIGQIGAALSDGYRDLSATITSERLARTDAEGAFASQTDTIFASLTGVTGPGGVATAISSAVATESLARASGDSTNASLIQSVASTFSDAVSGATASGFFGVSTSAAPGDAQARIAFLVSAAAGGPKKTAAMFIDALSDGTSRIIALADKIYLANGSDIASLGSALGVVGGVLTVKDAAITNLNASKITTGTLDVGTLISHGALFTSLIADEAVSTVLFYSVGDNGATDQTTGAPFIGTDRLSAYVGYRVILIFLGSVGREGGHDPSISAQFQREDEFASGVIGSGPVGSNFPSGGSNAPAIWMSGAIATDTVTSGTPYYRVRMTVSDSSHWRRWGGGLAVVVLKK